MYTLPAYGLTDFICEIRCCFQTHLAFIILTIQLYCYTLNYALLIVYQKYEAIH